jgi:hypothetical protein
MSQSGFGLIGLRLRRTGIRLAGVLLAAATGAGIALAQESPWAPELPLTRDCGTSARALGMGGAYLAISDDAAALRYNPAGLARVQRIELSGTLTDRSRDIETRYAGYPLESSLSRTHVSALGVVYPFPTYRGSLVAAFGYTYPWPFDLEYARAAASGTEEAPLQEQILEEGGLGEWSFGMAVDAGPNLSLGFRTTWLHGNRFQDWVYQDATHSIHDVLDVDLDGFTASFGALNRFGPVHLGLTIDLPRWIDMHGEIHDTVLDEIIAVDEEMTLPFSVGLGTAVPRGSLLLAGDARFTDWTQIDYYGPLRYTDPVTGQRRYAYERTWDFHLGAEYLLDFIHAAGVRVRAGWAYEPIPYQVLMEELEDTNQGDVLPVYRPADVDPQRMTWSVGLGVLAGESLTIDAAFTSGSWERTGLHLSEKETERRVLVSAAFRLE